MGFYENLDGTLENTFTLGDGTASDRYIQEDIGTSNYPGFRRLNSSGVWQYSNDGIAWSDFGTGTGTAWKAQIDISGLLVLVDQGAKVIANDYPALELDKGKTRFGIWSGSWQAAPTADVSLKIKFILATSGTGSYVRLALKTKAIGAGEDTAKVFDDTQFVAVAIAPTNVGPEYSGTITVSSAVFALHDVVTFYIGRDGNNELGAGNNDDYDKPIDIIAVEVL